jgi:hypothetical protein
MEMSHISFLALVLAATGCHATVDDATLAADCMKNGTQAFERYKAKLGERYGSMAQPGDPEFHFNKRLNTCLMKVDHFSFIPLSGLGPTQLNSVNEHQVIDVYSNRTLVETRYSNDWDPNTKELGSHTYGIDRDKFEVQAKRMMSE